MEGGRAGMQPTQLLPLGPAAPFRTSQNCGATLLAVGGSKPGSPVLMPASLGRSQPRMGDSLWLIETSFDTRRKMYSADQCELKLN